VLLFGCGISSQDDKLDYFFNDKKVVAQSFDIRNLAFADDFYFSESTADSLFYKYELTDSQGILMRNYNDSTYYNPVQIAQRALYFVSTYNKTQDSIYLYWAQKYADKLVETSKFYQNSLIFPYDFDFLLHGDDNFTMEAPWYSGMAQGQVLSLFSKLYEITNEDEYWQRAQLTYNSFFIELDSDNIQKDWISVVDSSNYLWIEEYPLLPVNYTLNGFLFSIIGLYDYYRIRPAKEVYGLLCAVLTTAKHNVHRFRSNKNVSYYCLSHKVQSLTYHEIHIDQIDYLFKITNDIKFKAESIFFSLDY
jgi:hypothetical protein